MTTGKRRPMIWIARDLEHVFEPERREWKGRPRQMRLGGKTFKPLTADMFKALLADKDAIWKHRSRFTNLLCAIHDDNDEKIVKFLPRYS